MPKVMILSKNTKKQIEVPAGTLLHDALSLAGEEIFRPCGGRGVCGKCAVRASGVLSPKTPSEEHLSDGMRLACTTKILGDAVIALGEQAAMAIETSHSFRISRLSPMGQGFGAAVDIGTTTVILHLFDLSDGRCVGEAAQANPQGVIAADVMGRIGAFPAEGERMRVLITDCVSSLLSECCEKAAVPSSSVSVFVLTGNTTMLYLLTGRDPACLGRAPFRADTLFDTETEFLGRRAYLPPCMDAFVGADITCAVLASGMCEKDETSLLCDLGTNGEIALWKNGTLSVTSTAAGPAFEGAGISSGCRSIPGAVDRVTPENGILSAHTIGELPPVGVCGSGLIDAIAAGLELELIDETGAADDDLLLCAKGGNVSLIGRDIRAVQLAKAAVAAGIRALLHASGTDFSEIGTLYLAGGFGSHLPIISSVRIGLLPAELADKVTVLGNAALAGTEELLLDSSLLTRAREIASHSRSVPLGGDPYFNEEYIEQMFF